MVSLPGTVLLSYDILCRPVWHERESVRGLHDRDEYDAEDCHCIGIYY